MPDEALMNIFIETLDKTVSQLVSKVIFFIENLY